MPYGEIFIGTFTTIWRHKKLWLFGLLGQALIAIGGGMYLVAVLGWQNNWFQVMRGWADRPGGVGPTDMPGAFMGSLGLLLVSLTAMILLALLGYVVNLAMRGATIHEAAIAWRGATTQTGRGLRAGLERAIYLFLLDLLWWMPAILLVGGAYLCGILGLMGLAASSTGRGDEDGAVVLAIFAVFCAVICLYVFVGLAMAIFAPLMYQFAVQGRRGLGQAISEGWRLASRHLGAMIVFWLLLLILNIVVSITLQLLTLPLAWPWLSRWFGWWTALMGDFTANRPPVMPEFTPVTVALAGIGSALASLLLQSFMQTFGLTLYAEVYRRLTGQASAPPPAVAPAPEPSAAAELPAPGDLGLTVPAEAAPSAPEEAGPRI